MEVQEDEAVTVERWFRYLFFSFPIWAYAAWGWYGYSDTDHGYIQALAWRIACGQLPYQDFALVRTPLSAWLHAVSILALPDFLEIPMERIFSLFQLFLITYFSLSWSKDQRAQPRYLWLLVALLVSVHGYPVMAWHTIDGLMFVSVGLYVWVNKNHRGWGLLLLWMAAGCKQVFLPVPIAATLFILFSDRSVRGWKHILAGAAGFMALVFLPEFIRSGSIFKTIFYLSSAGSLNELIDTGIIRWLPAIPAGIAGFWLCRFHHRAWVAMTALALMVLESGFQMYRTAWTGQFSLFFAYGWPIAIGLAAATFISDWDRSRLPVVFWMIAAWCASLSWGYPYPALAAAPLVMGMADYCDDRFPFTRWIPAQVTMGIVAVVLIIGAMLSHLFPYRDADALKDMDYCPVERLRFIAVGESSAAKWSEAMTWDSYYPHNTILPSCPQWDYLMDREPWFPCDWEHDVEMGWNVDSLHWKSLLASSGAYIFLEKDKQPEWNGQSRYPSHISAWIRREWQLTDSGTYFYIYEKNPSPLPAGH